MLACKAGSKPTPLAPGHNFQLSTALILACEAVACRHVPWTEQIQGGKARRRMGGPARGRGRSSRGDWRASRHRGLERPGAPWQARPVPDLRDSFDVRMRPPDLLLPGLPADGDGRPPRLRRAAPSAGADIDADPETVLRSVLPEPTAGRSGRAGKSGCRVADVESAGIPRSRSAAGGAAMDKANVKRASARRAALAVASLREMPA